MYEARTSHYRCGETFGVTPLPREFNPQALGNVTPRYSRHIDPSKLNINGLEVMQKLADTRTKEPYINKFPHYD
jgi:L-seryl-tRNA(Ser) seleniumtransferase